MYATDIPELMYAAMLIFIGVGSFVMTHYYIWRGE
jgi:hypothetical protein